jgi:hypothetical protein
MTKVNAQVYFDVSTNGGDKDINLYTNACPLKKEKTDYTYSNLNLDRNM